jgi:hypothetical protein
MLVRWKSPTCARAERSAEKDNLRNLIPRLALLVLVALGWWLWNSTLFPQARELIWRLDDHPESISQVEIQIYDHRGALLKREEKHFDRSPVEMVQKISIASGDYPVRIFVGRTGQGPIDQYLGTLHVNAERTIALALSEYTKLSSVTPR